MPEEETEAKEPQEASEEDRPEEEGKPKKKRKLFGFLKRGDKEEEKPQENVQVLHDAPPERLPPEPKEEKKLVWGEGKLFKKKEEVSEEEKDAAGEEYDLLKKIDKMLAGETPEEAGVEAPEEEPSEETKPAEAPKTEGKPEAAAPQVSETPEGEPPAEAKPAEAPKEEKKPEPKKEEAKPEEGGKKPKKKEVSYEENVISSDEFAALEKKESKGGLLGKLRGKKEEEEMEMAAPERPGAPTTTDLMLRIEKSEGRFEAVNTSIANIGERISHLSEEIGELRSSVLERERGFRGVQTEFAKVKDIVENIEPAKFTKSLEAMRTEFTKSEAKLEGMDTRMMSLKKKLDDLKEVMDKVQGIKNLMAVAETVRKILEKMEEKKAYITKTASKTESMFVEVEEKLREFEEYRKKIDSNAEMLYELMRSVDSAEAKLEKVSTKEAIEKMEERSEFLKNEYEDRVNELKDIISELVHAIRTGDILLKSGKKVFAPKAEIDRLKDKFEGLRKTGGVGISTEELDKVHAELIEHIAESMRKGRELNKRMDEFESKVHQDLVDSRLGLTKALKRANVEFGHEPEGKPRKKARKPAKKPGKKPKGPDRRVLDEARERLKEEVEEERRRETLEKEQAAIKEEKERLKKEARKLKAAMVKAHKMRAPKRKKAHRKRAPKKKAAKKTAKRKTKRKRKR